MIETKSRYYTRRGGFYWTCPICGSNLDAGERCTCEDEAKEDPVRAFEQGKLRDPAADPEPDSDRDISSMSRRLMQCISEIEAIKSTRSKTNNVEGLRNRYKLGKIDDEHEYY